MESALAEGRTRPLSWELLSQVGRDQWERILRKVLGVEVRRPWMRRRELDLLVDLLGLLQPRRCLEWGSGYSTAYFPTLLGTDATWLALEHDLAWSERVKEMAAGAGVQVVHIAPRTAAGSDPGSSDSAEIFREYIDYPADRGPFDFILVDGRARIACWELGHALLAEGGVMVLHDANRERYQGAFSTPLAHVVLRDHRRTSGGVCIATRRADFVGLVDVQRQTHLWSAYRKLGRFIHV